MGNLCNTEMFCKTIHTNKLYSIQSPNYIIIIIIYRFHSNQNTHVPHALSFFLVRKRLQQRHLLPVLLFSLFLFLLSFSHRVVRVA